MRRKTLFWQLYPSFLVLIILTMGGLTFFAGDIFERFHYQHLREDLHSRAQLLLPQATEYVQAGRYSELNELIKRLGRASDTRLTVMLPDGRVVADSEEIPELMENHASRPEMRAALGGDVGESIRRSRTLNRRMMYVATPLTQLNDTIGVMRASVPVRGIEETLGVLYRNLVWGGLVIALIAALLGVLISRRFTGPLGELKQGAMRFAAGDFTVKLPDSEAEEISELAGAMNRMAQQIDERLRNEVRQRNEQEAVLSSMSEGVLAVDSDERLINLNRAAIEMLGIRDHHLHGRTIQEVIRNTDLQKFIRRALRSSQPVEGQIVLYGDRKRYLQVQGTILRDARQKAIGAVVVLHDITRLRELENVRRDFVANVSHELRTPITSIKGFAETMLDAEGQAPEDGQRFLGIILRQANRLNAIIEDLLSLARIEQEAEQGAAGIERQESSIREVLAGALQICSVKAAEKSIELKLECPAELRAPLNAPLIEQALVNLIDNAMKYSDAGGSVEVVAEETPKEIILRVIDHGVGIEKAHLSRLFERFYRVDKARSRKLGGTGLGLAIVKHIAQAHQGRVDVESEVGAGSTFSLVLPKEPMANGHQAA